MDKIGTFIKGFLHFACSCIIFFLLACFWIWLAQTVWVYLHLISPLKFLTSFRSLYLKLKGLPERFNHAITENERLEKQFKLAKQEIEDLKRHHESSIFMFWFGFIIACLFIVLLVTAYYRLRKEIYQLNNSLPTGNNSGTLRRHFKQIMKHHIMQRYQDQNGSLCCPICKVSSVDSVTMRKTRWNWTVFTSFATVVLKVGLQINVN